MKSRYPETWSNILQMLSDQQAHRVGEIAQHIGKSSKTISNTLRRMEHHGMIVQVDHGWYKLPSLVSPEVVAHQAFSGHAGVYLLRYQELYKIGKSINVPERIGQLRLALPFDVQHIHTIAAVDPAPLEKQLHERFADKRIRGEWFALDVFDIDEICDM